MPRVAALELGDNFRPGGEPPGQDLNGRVTERPGHTGDFDACFVAQVQGADPERGEVRDALAGVGDECGHGCGAQ